MKAYGNLPSSQEPVEEYLEGCFSDGGQSAPSNLIPMPQAFLSQDRMTAFSRLSRSGMTFALSTDDHGEELLTSFLAGFRARISPSQEPEKDSAESDQASGQNSRESLARYDRDSCSWRIPQLSLLGDSEEFSEIWPRWGMMRNGVCWGRTTSEPLTEETGSGFLPTLTVCGNNNRKGASKKSGDGLATALLRMLPTLTASDATGGPGCSGRQGGQNLRTALAMLPTLTAQDAKNNGSASQQNRDTRPLNAVVGGPLNPDWCEWFMGFPIGWTGLKPLAMDRFRQWLQGHGLFCQKESASLLQMHDHRDIVTDE